MCTLMKLDGTEEKVEPKNGKEWELEELQLLVGGYIETFPTPFDDQVMVMHEEAKLQKHHKLNAKASHLVRDILMNDDYIAGDAVVVSRSSLGE